MNTIKKILKQKANIAIIGNAGCGKGVVSRSILAELLSNNKKVLVLEPLGEREYKEFTDALGGNHIFYENVESIDYANKLTTITFPFDKERPEIELIINIINEAEHNGVEAVLIDEAWGYLKDYEKINTDITVQLIINTQFNTDILENENSAKFKTLFKTLFLMGRDHFNIQYTYPKLLELYNINQSIIEYLKIQQPFESIIITESKVIAKNFKVEMTNDSD